MIWNDLRLDSYFNSVAKKLVTNGEFGKQLDKCIKEAYYKGREDLYKEIELQKIAIEEIIKKEKKNV